jgi:phage-related minor tail protein
MVHDAFASAFNGINDQLSRLMTGQKTSWASFLQSLGAQISKMGLMGLEHEIAAKIMGSISARQQQAGANPANQPAAQHGITAVLGKIFGEGTLKRDGNTPATALFVTMTGANGIPMWSTGTNPASITTPDFGVTSGDLNQLEYGGAGGSTTNTLETIANGAAKSTPGIGGEILSAAAKVAEAFINHLHSNKSESSSSSGGSSSGGSMAPGAQQGDVLTRDPSGLIIRTPAPAGPNQRSMVTLDNGARPKPSVWGQIGKASLQLFQAWLAHTSSSGGDSGGGGGGGEEVDSTITYHAKGGRPRVGKLAVVGEKGPELFVPDTAGTIIPNHKLTSVMGKPFGGFRATGGSVDPSRAYMVGERGPEAFATIGAPGHDGASAQPYQMVYYTIDARGTDPVLTEQRTRGAIVAAHQSAIVNSVQTNDELAKRRPQR